MYRIHQVLNTFNYDENVVVTKFFVKNENDELYCKTLSSDKSVEEMKQLSRPWSLTTLCINTDKSISDLTSIFGQSFKRCFVRYVKNSTSFDFTHKVGYIDAVLEVSLKDDFTSCHHFDIHSEFPIQRVSQYEKQIKLDNLVGYKKL